MRKILLLMLIFLTLILSVSSSFSYPATDSSSPLGPLRYSGENSTLMIDTDVSQMRHDGQDNGHTSISLLSKNGTILFQRKLDHNFRCIGYNRARHAFILRSVGEEGIWLKVYAFEYLPEDKPAIVYSKSFTRKYLAALEAIIPSPDFRFIAFVGRPTQSRTWHLYVLDTKLDTVKLLGKAPDPPPFLKSDFEKAVVGSDPCDNWQWGFGGPALESNICQFLSPRLLKVSYGKDTCRHRAKNRFIHRWTL
jgi:hypothetical protein